MNDDHRYEERVTSNWPRALFATLSTLFFLLLIWRVNAGGFDILSAVFLVLSGVFFFYVVNYRALIIYLNPESLMLRFGATTWGIPLDNIEGFPLDEIPLLMRYGGTGRTNSETNELSLAARSMIYLPSCRSL